MERALAAGASKPPAVADGIVLRRALFERLQRAGRVVAISAPAGSGKTLLVRSWICEAGLADAAAWVSVRHKERDPQRFWISVVDALHGTATPVRGLTAAPSLDGGAIVERLLEDLASLEDRVWLVIDDLHELHSPEALSQLELLLMRAPAALRFVVSSRHDLGLGLHRLRLKAELTEIRAADLRFTLDDCVRAAGRGRSGAVGHGAGAAPWANRGVGGGSEAGGAVARRSPRPGVARGGVLRKRPHGRRLPGRGGARPPTRGGQAAAPAHVGARPHQRAARRRVDGRLGRGADPAGARGGERLRRLARRPPDLVSLPQPVRGPAAAGAAADRA